jgi:hypothetical protein
MTTDRAEEQELANDPLIASLTPEEKETLQTRYLVTTGDEVVWVEPDGRIRREKLSSLYYIRTRRGVYRVSRISNEVVEV